MQERGTLLITYLSFLARSISYKINLVVSILGVDLNIINWAKKRSSSKDLSKDNWGRGLLRILLSYIYLQAFIAVR